MQDFRLAEMVAAEGRACVVCVNKWDAVPDKKTNTMSTYEADVLAQLHPVNWATVVFTSAKKGKCVLLWLRAAGWTWMTGRVAQKCGLCTATHTHTHTHTHTQLVRALKAAMQVCADRAALAHAEEHVGMQASDSAGCSKLRSWLGSSTASASALQPSTSS